VEAAFFDLDKTVIAKASMVAFGRPLLDAGMINRRLLVRALWSHMVFEVLGADEARMLKFRESALRITRGWDQARVSALVRDTLAEVVAPIVYDEALDLIREHQAAGRKVFIISASPEEIVAPLARYLGADRAIASRARLDDQGRYTGEVDFYSYGPFKAEAVREVALLEGIDLEGSFAYSDSATDLPLLEAVGHPVAVNPDRELARAARDRGWEVVRFVQGVPLRERVPMPAPAVAIGVAGGAVVVGSAAAVVWLMTRRRRPPPPTARVWVARLSAMRPGTVRPAPGRSRTVGVGLEAWLRRRPRASSPRRRQGRGRRESR
jgi:HAD superfamily hydrolase (TIGR01490 family)